MKFDRQIFISYAHLDNQPLTADQAGWVSLFHSTLQTLLSQRLGAPADIWRDDKLRGNDTFSDEILKQLAGTAIFVSILTPRYLKSEWCTKEIRSFCQQAEAGQSLVVDNKARVIKVLKLPVDTGQSLPPVVGQQLGYEFYEFDEDHTPRELDPAYGDKPRQAFLRKANKLAWDLAAQLTELQRPHPDAGKADDAPGTRPAVFLAECSRDRREARDSIASELACCGFRVLPETRLPDDEDEYLTAVGALLETCVLSVHLVGSGYGRVPDGDRQQSVVVLQNELAAARSRSHGLRRVIDAAFSSLNRTPNIIVEVDSLPVLMDMVTAGMAASLQPWSALARQPEGGTRLRWLEMADAGTMRRNLLCSLSDDELSPAALATRGVLRQVVGDLVASGSWKGVSKGHL